MSKAAELANLIGNINAGGGGVNKNVIINGAMNVAQRSTSETVLGGDTSTYRTVDRFKILTNGTDGRFTMTQDSSAPSGFANSTKFACTTADTSIASGAFDDDNAGSLEFNIYLHAGSDFTSGSLNENVWEARDFTKQASGISSFFDSTSRTFFITGVQLEVGQNATEFEHEPFERTLAKCQRYYHRLVNNTAYDTICHGHFGSDTSFFGTIDFPVTMRAEPTITESGDWRIYTDSAVPVTSGPIVNRATTHVMDLRCDTGDNNDVGQGAMLQNNNDTDAYIELKAEL
jgi:hypothetical protein